VRPAISVIDDGGVSAVGVGYRGQPQKLVERETGGEVAVIVGHARLRHITIVVNGDVGDHVAIADGVVGGAADGNALVGRALVQGGGVTPSADA
jgi:hypothetical protein